MIELPSSLITNSANGGGGGDCGCSDLEHFNVIFEDCILPGISTGFADAAEGSDRREVICAVLKQLEGLIGINQSTCEIDEPKVNVKIMPSDSYPNYAVDGDLAAFDEGILGFASFYVALGTNGSIGHPIPWVILNSGENAEGYDENDFHMYARFNFTDVTFFADYENASTPPITEYDLYSVVLHEFTHALGFASSFSLDPLSQVQAWGNTSPAQRGFYFPLDQYLGYNDADLLVEFNAGGMLGNGGEYTFNSTVNYLDIFSECAEITNENLYFAGEVIGNHTFYAGDALDPGTSFSHLDGYCVEGETDFVPFVMNRRFNLGAAQRDYLPADLDVLRTIGYNIICDDGDYGDFDCNAEACIVVAIGEQPALEETCLPDPTIFVIEICPPLELGEVEIEIPTQTLLANDINATSVAYARVNDGSSSIALSADGLNLVFSTTTLGLHNVTYAVQGCEGATSNDVVFTIQAVLSGDPACLFFCPDPVTVEELILPSTWQTMVTIDDCNDDENLLCNGGFCGAFGADDSDSWQTDLSDGLQDLPYKKLHPLMLEDFMHVNNGFVQSNVAIGGWRRASGTPWFISTTIGETDFQAGSVVVRSSTLNFENTTSGIMNAAPFDAGKKYLLGFDAGVLTDYFSADIRLIYLEEFTPSGLSPGLPPPIYNSASQGVFSIVDEQSSNYPTERFKMGFSFAANEHFTGIYFDGQYDVAHTSAFLMDDVQLIEDNFSAGEDLYSLQCNQVHTLGGVDFNTLSGVEVQYSWYKVDVAGEIITPELVTYTSEDEAMEFDVAPAQTTTYRLVRSLLNLSPTLLFDFCQTLADGTEVCCDTDDITVFVANGLADASFTTIQTNCGQYTLTADPNTENLNHTWSVSSNGMPAQLFSEVYQPESMLPNGDHTIIHTVSNDCGVSTAEVAIVGIDCLTCPCEDPNTTNFNIDAGEGLSITQTPLWNLVNNTPLSPATYNNNNGCIAIRGRLIIDQIDPFNPIDFGIFGGEIRMQPGSEIVVNTYSRMGLQNVSQAGGIHGCEEMWEGITLDENAMLFMQNNQLSDAIHGVSVNNKSSIDLIENDFVANYISLFSAPATGTKVIFSEGSTPLVNNDFTGGTLLLPYVGQNSQAGIFLNNTVMEIGQSNDETNKNNFLSLNNGIVANESNIGIHYAQISGLPMPMFSLNDLDQHIGTGILLHNASARAWNNTIDATNLGNIGILAHRSSLDARANFLTIPYAIELLSCNNETFFAQRNIIDINNKGAGVLLFNSDAITSAVIENNSFTSSTGEQVDFILMNNPGVPILTGEKRITGGNTFTIPKENQRAINLINVGNWDISTCDIDYTGAGNTAAQGTRAITAFGCEGLYLYNNDIDAANIGAFYHGLMLSNTVETKACCNSINNGHTNMTFYGYGENTMARHTNIGDATLGLNQWPGTVIGERNLLTNIFEHHHTGNLWNGVYSWTGARNTGDDNDIDRSIFLIQPDMPDEKYWPLSLPFTPNSTSTWFVEDDNAADSCESDISCPPATLANEIDEAAINRLSAYIFTGAYSDMLNWERENYRLAKLSNVPSLQNTDSDLFDFVSGNTQTNLGQYQKLRTDIKELYQISGNYHSLAAGVLDVEIRLIGIYEALATITDETIIQQLQVEKQEILEALANEWESFVLLKLGAINTQQQVVSSLLADNGNLSNSTVFMDNEKTVNELFLSTVAVGQYYLNAEQLDLLLPIAEQCTMEGGKVVYRARALYQLAENRDFTDDCTPTQALQSSDEGSSLGRLSMDTDARGKAIEQISVYPNPTKQFIQLELTDVLAEQPLNITLYNVQGQHLQHWTTDKYYKPALRRTKYPSGYLLVEC